VALEIDCPRCGSRPHTEFRFGGQERPIRSDDAEADFARVYLLENPAGPQRERWYHALGCKGWFVLTRDTTNNRTGD
jgi:sarcosine oxidase subunit delta